MISVEDLACFYPHPVLLLGPPGVGKSQTVRSLAKKLSEQMGLKFVEINYKNFNEILETEEKLFIFYDFRLTEVEPSDIIGIPREFGDGVIFKPPLWVLCFQKHPGILFLDELTLVQRDDVLAIAYKLILDKRAGDVEFCPGVWVIAAGNDPQSNLARPLPAALINRLIVVPFQPPTVEEWAQYMDSIGEWDKRVYAYLKRFPKDFLKVENIEMLENFPTPRSWSKVAMLMPKVKKSEEAMRLLATGCLGREIGEKFLTFINHPVPEVEKLVKQPELFKQLDLDTKYIFVVTLSNWLTEEQRLEQTKNLLNIISEEREFIILLLVCLPAKLRPKLLTTLNKDRLKEIIDIIRFMVGGRQNV